MTIKQISLYYKEASSDKEYRVQLEEKDGGYVVNFQYGRRGSTLTAGSKTASPVSLAEAEKIYADVLKKQFSKGYTEGEAGTSYVGTSNEERKTGMVPQLLNPIDESEVEQYLKDPAWGAQEKKDGKHIMIKAVYKGDKISVVTASNRKGLQVGIPEPVAKALNGFEVELDGEMIGDVYHVFDCLSTGRNDFRTSPYDARHLRSAVVVGISDAIKVVPLARTEGQKRALYEKLKKENKEGIVFKRLSSVYVPGRPASGGNMLKHKFYATCSCIVAEGRSGKRSIALTLNEVSGPRSIKVVSVGNCTVPANQPIPKIGDIVEIRYLYAYKGGSLFQPVLLGVRDDLDQVACDMKQLKYKAEDDKAEGEEN